MATDNEEHVPRSLHAAHTLGTWPENIGRLLCGVEFGQASTGVLERRA